MDDLDFQKAVQEIKDGIKARRAAGRDISDQLSSLILARGVAALEAMASPTAPTPSTPLGRNLMSAPNAAAVLFALGLGDVLPRLAALERGAPRPAPAGEPWDDGTLFDDGYGWVDGP